MPPMLHLCCIAALKLVKVNGPCSAAAFRGPLHRRKEVMTNAKTMFSVRPADQDRAEES